MDDRLYMLRWCVAAALGGLSVAAPAAFAQTAPPPAAGAEASGESVDLNEIIVTARRVEERLQDVPISITVYNQEQLSNRNVVNAGDLAAFTPSLSDRKSVV